MLDRSAIVLAIDGLSARMLGPYANTWFATHYFDSLAAQSLLLEFAFTDCTELKGAYQSLWTGRPQYASLNSQEVRNELAQQLADQGIESTLFTDEPKLDEWMLAQQFDRVVLNPAIETGGAANDPSETALAEFFAAAIEHAALIKPGSMLWLHSQGLQGPWDAPYEMRKQFADEEDPDPPTFVDAPHQKFDSREFDPDVRLGFQQACAAQVVLMDQFLGILLEHIEKMPPSKQPLLIVTSPRGFPMGTGGYVGQVEQSLFDDAIQVPFLVRWPDQRQALNRHQGLQYSSRVFELVAEWFGGDSDALSWVDHPLQQPRQELILTVAPDQVALRTCGWKFMTRDGHQKLFVKPDDRWDTNDVIRKCRMVGEELSELCDSLAMEIKANGKFSPVMIPERLAENFS
jgi:hypothetical protein